ncbi:ras protein [Phaffia rhodozyma]|uniref:Ras protein n=1 Tax=Phaffia rhodozyma TaxID=264483 RepID=A0A0F7SFF9_PHARH|nr:ras protein [Phaffia rhodozyma]
MNTKLTGSNKSKCFHRITMLGDGGVGKTALAVQFTSAEFVQDYDPTIEDSYRKNLVIEGEQHVIEIFDTAGQEEYSALRSQWIKEGEAVILVYSIASAISFNRIPEFFQSVVDLKRQIGENSPPMILIGNKCDRGSDGREVSFANGVEMAELLGIEDFYELSAMTRTDIEESFQKLIAKLMDLKTGVSDEELCSHVKEEVVDL